MKKLYHRLIAKTYLNEHLGEKVETLRLEKSHLQLENRIIKGVLKSLEERSKVKPQKKPKRPRK